MAIILWLFGIPVTLALVMWLLEIVPFWARARQPRTALGPFPPIKRVMRWKVDTPKTPGAASAPPCAGSRMSGERWGRTDCHEWAACCRSRAAAPGWTSNMSDKETDRGSMLCQRCRGLLVYECFSDLRDEAGRMCLATRCINCGYIEDSVVRSNRLRATAIKRAIPRRMVGKVMFPRCQTERYRSAWADRPMVVVYCRLMRFGTSWGWHYFFRSDPAVSICGSSDSCRDHQPGVGMKSGTVAQNCLIHNVAALKAAEHPKGATPAVALKIDTHFIFQVPAATRTAQLSTRSSRRPCCLGKHSVHGALLSVVSLMLMKCLCSGAQAHSTIYRQPNQHTGNLPSLTSQWPGRSWAWKRMER